MDSSRNFDSLGLVYIVAGNSPNKLCSACGTNNKAYGNTCLSSCPLGTTANTYKDGGIACLGTAVSASPAVSNTVSVPTSTQTSTPSVVNSAPSVLASAPSVIASTPSAIASNSSVSSSSSSASSNPNCPVNAFFNGN